MIGKGHAPTSFPEARGQIAQLIEALAREAEGIPAAHHLAPRKTKPGTLDLTASTLFVKDIPKHALISSHARTLNKLVNFRNGQINLGAALDLFFRTLHGLHALWRQKTLLTSDDLTRTGLAWDAGRFLCQDGWH